MFAQYRLFHGAGKSGQASRLYEADAGQRTSCCAATASGAQRTSWPDLRKTTRRPETSFLQPGVATPSGPIAATS
jgi:hypothetical protein